MDMRKRRASKARYEKSAKGRAAQARYNQSEKGRARRRNFYSQLSPLERARLCDQQYRLKVNRRIARLEKEAAQWQAS